jgi:hypothetical protein
MAVLLNGTTDFLTLTPSPVLTPPLTMACWVNDSNVTVESVPISISHTVANNDYYAVVILANGVYRAQQDLNSVGVNAASAGNAVANQWTHVAAVFASTTSRLLYINGVQTSNATSLAFGSPNTAVIGSIYLGTTPPIDFFPGKIAYPSIWSAALLQSEVIALSGYEDPRSVQRSNLVSFLPFQPNAPFKDIISGFTWNVTGSPTLTPDPFVLFPNVTCGASGQGPTLLVDRSGGEYEIFIGGRNK